jgi:hypothetical protein
MLKGNEGERRNQKRFLGLPITYKGVVVSLNPRKIPCMANVRRTAGAPIDLTVKYFNAGFSMGESCSIRRLICNYFPHSIQLID